MSGKTVGLDGVLEALEQIAPLALAEEWDNVGLLLEPEPARHRPVSAILLTIDLTDPVLEEARDLGAELVVAYHPPIFAPLDRLTQADPRHRTLLSAIAAGTAVYSPHTALDAAPGGVNDWLADGLAAGSAASRIGIPDAGEATRAGPGRRLELSAAISLETAVERVKQHLGLERVRVATPPALGSGREVRSIALCAGAGGQVISAVEADLYLTGEMRHHEVLALVEKGSSVILCEHTNTERGYLPVLARRLGQTLGEGVRVQVSGRDTEPLGMR